MANNRVFAFFQMAPYVGTSLLELQLMKPEYRHKKLVWMVRFSNEDGMLTIHAVGRRDAENKRPYYLARYALTNQGWERGEALLIEDIRSRMRKDISINNTNIGEYIQSLVEHVEKDMPGLELDVDNYIIPENELVSSQLRPVEYVEVKNENIVWINDRELLSLIVCPVTNLIMTDPVTMTIDGKNGRTCDKSAIGPDLIEMVNYIPNHTLRNVIKYIVTIYSSHASVKLRREKLASLEFDLSDPVMSEPMTNAVLLRSGHCFDQSAVDGLFAGEKQFANCPKTQMEIYRGREIIDKNISKIAAKLPDIKQEVELLIEAQLKREAAESSVSSVLNLV